MLVNAGNGKYEMENEQFEKLIAEAVEALPKSIRTKLNNVEIVMEAGESPNNSLFGLYHGVPHIRRGASYGFSPTLPDKITIWKGTIEKFALGQTQNISSGIEEQAVANMVRRVVWHEIGHHFGFDEEGVRKLEEKWAKEGKI